MASYGMIKGKINFYGKTKKYRSEETEYCLCIENPEFLNIDKEALEKAFPLPNKKSDPQRPAKIQSILDGEEVDKMYFNSDYPVTKVWVKKETIEAHEVKNPELKGMDVVMKLTGVHIGALLLSEIPEEFSPNPFNMEDFDEDELPFK